MSEDLTNTPEIETEEDEPAKKPEAKKAAVNLNATTVWVPNGFWSPELKKSFLQGPYVPQNAKEAKVLSKYKK